MLFHTVQLFSLWNLFATRANENNSWWISNYAYIKDKWKFIDKTFSIVADILLRVIPKIFEEKKTFTFYKDGVIWFF